MCWVGSTLMHWQQRLLLSSWTSRCLSEQVELCDWLQLLWSRAQTVVGLSRCTTTGACSGCCSGAGPVIVRCSAIWLEDLQCLAVIFNNDAFHVLGGEHPEALAAAAAAFELDK
jgi:hypothetical protein